MVLAILIQLRPLSIDDSHLTTAPVLPVKLSEPLLPEQTVALEFTVPPTLKGVTVIVEIAEFALEQAPL